MRKEEKKLRYIAYIRKSSEDKEKQELSHEGQIEAIKKQFSDLNIIDWVIESKSAFKPGRKLFNQTMDRIDDGEADGIVGYHPNRLARNEIDSGRITYALRESNALKDLKFASYTFNNDPEGIMFLQFTMSQGQYESSKQAKDVRRGMRIKASHGEMPGKVWPGYKKVPVLGKDGTPLMNLKENKVITKTDIDPERYYTIKKVWDWFLYDRLTPSQIWKRVNEECNYRTVTFKYRPTEKYPDGRIGGGSPMTKSMVYRILRSPFYAGKFEHQSELFEGKHTKMIEWGEYLLAQDLLGAKGNKRYTKHDHIYAGMLKCGECSCMIQARYNTKYIKKSGNYTTYVYYYCSRKSMSRPCTQRVYTPISSIEADIVEALGNFRIIPEFKELALKILQRKHKLDANDRSNIYENLQNDRNSVQKQLDKLLSVYLKEEIHEAEYKRKQAQLNDELHSLDEKLRNTEKGAENSTELYERAFDFAVHAQRNFMSGDVRTKRDILRTFGQSITLKDNKLYIEPNEWLAPIADGYSELEKRYLWVVTNKKAQSKELERALVPILQTWRAQRDSNPRHAA